MASSKLFEEYARRLIQRELAKPVIHNDDGRKNGLVDLLVGDAQTPHIAIECTAAVDSDRTETWNVGPGRGKLQFDLSRDWHVVIKPHTCVRELRRKIEGLLQECERTGIERFTEADLVLKFRHPAIFDVLAALEIHSINAFGDEGSGSVFLTMTGLGGWVDPTGSAVPTWIGEFLRDAKNGDVLAKLKCSGAAESHVFVGVSFGGVPWQVESYLGTQTELLPADPPNLPEPITAVWIMYGGRGVRWDGTRWKFFDAVVPMGAVIDAL